MSTPHRNTRKATACFLLTVGATLAGWLQNPQEVEALGGSCRAWFVNEVGTTQAAGSCTHLNSDTKARVTLDLTLSPDYHSSWFTKTNRVYRTPKWSANMFFGRPHAARVDLGKR